MNGQQLLYSVIMLTMLPVVISMIGLHVIQLPSDVGHGVSVTKLVLSFVMGAVAGIQLAMIGALANRQD